ncbi:hypothetical protein ACHHYP_06903 [Achlya hypogyna]|uniref:Mitochondrial splicing suppressor 51-like C-terminal domain-containing protein n=1 Tax=Achlya hypogyna TaxID=1202772 RepID=A0A1V9ZMY5_ACHHY|nr:hypothetical protein ACHHYP_06903 [Achlya hypogyna]
MWSQPPTSWSDFPTWAASGNDATATPLSPEDLSYTHSRSMTILKALQRCKLLTASKYRGKKYKEEAHMKLVLHIVGADQREGRNVQETMAAFAQLITAFGNAGNHDHGYDELVLVLIGPNIETRLHSTSQTESISSSGKSIRVVYASEVWSDHVAGSLYESPTAIFCFNAGVWGYDEWIPAFQHMMREEIHTPIIITSYNELEAIDDADCLEDIETPFVWRWKHEPNAFLCLKRRATQHTLADRVLNENSSWQCICATPLA